MTTPVGQATRPAPQQPSAHSAGNGITGAILTGALITGGVSQLAGRALSTVRLVAAFPNARAAGRLPMWAFELAVQKSTIDIVPPRGGYWNLWGKAFAASQALKGAGAIATIALAGSATVSAINKGGLPALGNTTQGRTGVAATIASIATLGFMGVAATHARNQGTMAMFRNMFTDDMLGTWKVVGPALAAWTFIGANELGYFDGLNKGETRSSDQVTHDAWEKTKDLPAMVRTKLAGLVD